MPWVAAKTAPTTTMDARAKADTTRYFFANCADTCMLWGGPIYGVRIQVLRRDILNPVPVNLHKTGFLEYALQSVLIV